MSGPVVRNHTLSQSGGNVHANRCPRFIFSTPSTPTKSLSQDTVSSTAGPASTRNESTSDQALGDQLREPSKKPDNKLKMRRTSNRAQGDLLPNLPDWLEEFTVNLVMKGFHLSRDTPTSSSHESDPEPPRKSGNRASTVFIRTFRRTKIAKYAGEPKLRGLLAQNAVAKPYLERKHLVTWITGRSQSSQ